MLIAALDAFNWVTFPTLPVMVEPCREESLITEFTVMVDPVSVERFMTAVISEDTTKEDS